jgi:large subunit ribosomal protein L18e
MKRSTRSNPHLCKSVGFLTKTANENDAKIWKYVADCLSKTRRKRISVNLSRINRHTEKGQIVAVPGKVLGAGLLRHPVTVAAFEFSATAKEKIRNARGKYLTINELVKKNPKGSNVKVVG